MREFSSPENPKPDPYDSSEPLDRTLVEYGLKTLRDCLTDRSEEAPTYESVRTAAEKLREGVHAIFWAIDSGKYLPQEDLKWSSDPQHFSSRLLNIFPENFFLEEIRPTRVYVGIGPTHLLHEVLFVPTEGAIFSVNHAISQDTRRIDDARELRINKLVVNNELSDKERVVFTGEWALRYRNAGAATLFAHGQERTTIGDPQALQTMLDESALGLYCGFKTLCPS
jgi:hypothetical protein